MKLYLNKPALLTTLGAGVDRHTQCLLGENAPRIAPNHLLYRQADLQGKVQYLASIDEPLRAFPENLPQAYRSRNNQLLWHALTQIEDQIHYAIENFGQKRIAVVIGTSTTGVDENLPLYRSAFLKEDWQSHPFNYTQQQFNAPSDFVAYQYGLKNVVYGISTACTSGARALMSAARLLKADLCDAVICGGVDCLSPLTVSGFASLSVLNPAQTQAFSQNRAGINIGEGVGLFLMTKTPLTDYIAYLGGGASSDAYHMSSPDPSGNGAKIAFEKALQNAHCTADQVGWINAHGTGTIHNDAMESLAIAEIFGSATPVTSTKPYTGHTLGAAGAVEAGISWGILHKKNNPQGKLPAQFWDQQRDEKLAPIAITQNNQYWKTKRRIVASSSFAFGGNNTVLILGELDEE